MKRHSLLLRYGVALVAVGVALLVKLLLDPLIVQHTPFLLVFGAIMVSAWYGGLGPGLLATFVAGAVTDYFFLYPKGSFTGFSLEAVPLYAFVLEGTLVCLLVAALHAARERAEASALESESHRESLLRSEQRFRALVQHSSDVITVVDGEGTIRYVSPAVERVTGYRPEDLEGHSIFRYVRPDRIEEGRSTFANLSARPGVHPSFEFEVPRKDGTWSKSEFLVNNLLDDPSVRGVVINQRDITERKEAETKLRESEELHRTVVEQAAENIFLLDPHTKHVLQANASLHRSLGYEAEELKNLTLYDIVAHIPENIDRNIQRILEEGRLFIGERQYRRKDGSLIDVEVNAASISYGGSLALCVVAHDVTQRKRAEEALKRSLDALLALYETGQVLSSSLERKEIGSRLLEIVGRISGTSAAVINLRDDRGMLNTWRTFGPDGLLRKVHEAPEAREGRLAAFESGEVGSFRLKSPKTDNLAGLSMPMRVRDQVIGVLEVYGPEQLVESETADTFASLANQAASALENARLYEEIIERERQLHDLVIRLLAVQEEERRRIAYDIHDGLAQTAAAAHQHLQAFARHHPPGSMQAKEELDESLDLMRQAVGDARQVIHDLRPTVLDDFGLAAAVRQQVTMLRSEGWQVSLEDKLGDERLPPEIETTLFRVVQEALTNVRKHAQASRVHVALDRQGGAVRLLIRDEGRGFRPDEEMSVNGPGERVGLSGIRERVSLLGGRFELHSEPGSGTTITAEIELPATTEDADHAG